VNAKKTESVRATSDTEIQKRPSTLRNNVMVRQNGRENTDRRQHDWRKIQEDKVREDSKNATGFLN
jgi:hypothetical protein